MNDKNQRMYFPPESQGVSPSQQMSKSIIRLSCDLAVVGGVSLRQIALLFSSLFLIPISSPYTFFLLNGDMELYRNRHLFVEEMF